MAVAAALNVEVSGLVKHFGERQVLHGLDLSIPAGEFVAIVGRSGCGKSTLLRQLAGLDTFSGGAISLDGKARDASATRCGSCTRRLVCCPGGR
jgi:sulfonate transport system ATP-binding protein